MIRNLLCAICLATTCVFSCQPVRADAVSINGSPGFGFQGPVVAPNEAGGSYWAHPSSDGPKANVGFYLTKTGLFAASPLGNNSPAIPGSQLDYWAGGSGQADPSLTFSPSGGLRISLYATVAGYKSLNELGWYEVTANGPGTLHPLFKGVVEDGSKVDSTTFNPTSPFGFYLRSPDGLFFSQTQYDAWFDLLMGGSYHQHFSPFRDDGTGSLWFGVEDTVGPNAGEKGGDFNDLVFRLDPLVVVPEPSSLLLLGLAGALGFAASRRLRGSLPGFKSRTV
jgi:hypothetical protein